MVLPLLCALLATGADPPDRTPVVAGIFPPGVAVGSRVRWTIAGRNLDRATAVVATGDGLLCRDPVAAADGRSLTVEVEAAADAPQGYREVRVDGPSGISNLAIVRVDPLEQAVEVEPNDRGPAPGRAVRVGTAIAGTIRPLDVDRFEVAGRPGLRVTLDWEVRRLGTAIVPVLTATGPGRAPLGQFRSSPGADRDCRAGVVIPPQGWFEVELRDNTFGGDDRAHYRLRVDPAPHGAGLFPLGIARGKLLHVTLGGGSLARPLGILGSTRQAAGSWLEPGPFPSLFGGYALLAPGRLRVVDADRPRLVEPDPRADDAPRPVAAGAAGVVVDGRIGRPGEVDRYRVEARAGDRFRARVDAAPAGSWLDSVLVVLGPGGARLGANDDRAPASPLEPPRTIDGAATTDSEVDVAIAADGPITVELADRYGGGGPAYGYRLELGPPHADFAVDLLRDPAATDLAAEARGAGAIGDAPPPGVGPYAAFNLRPGTTTPVPFLIVPRGRPGTVEVRAEGLPAGVDAEPVAIRLAPAPRPGSAAAARWDAPPVVDSIRLRVRPDARPTAGRFRVVARSRAADGTTLDRAATRVVGVGSAGGPDRPVVRELAEFPIRVLGD